MLLKFSSHLLTQVASRRLDNSHDLTETLLEDDLAKAMTAIVSQLAMKVELDLISDHATGHGKDAILLHSALHLSHIDWPTRPDWHLDPASLRQLHPDTLELLPIDVTGRCKL
jgi:hypothetical protein